MGSTGLVPEEPVVSVIYRGFLLGLNTSVDTSSVNSVEYQYRSSTDSSIFGDWQPLAVTYSSTFFRFIHDSLYIDVYYEYRLRLIYNDGNTSEWSDYAIPGNGQTVLDEGSVSSLDQLAASLGTVTSGFLRGVVFETSANNPKVRMDPSGFYAISNTSTPIFINAATGAADFTGTITGGVVQTATPGGARLAMIGASNSFDIYNSSATPIVRLDGANGLSLVASQVNGGQANQSITWHDNTTTGTLRAAITPYLYGGISRLKIDAFGTGGNYSSVDVTANGTDTAGLFLSGAPSSNMGSLSLACDVGQLAISPTETFLGAYGARLSRVWAGSGGSVKLEVSGGGQLLLSGGSLVANTPFQCTSLTATSNFTLNGDVTSHFKIANGYNAYMNGVVVQDANGGWLRTYGSTGWFNNDNGGGIHMSDTTYIRTYGSKHFYCDRMIWAAGALRTGTGVQDTTNAALYIHGGTGGATYFYNGAWQNIDYQTATSHSDRRSKKNIKPIKGALSLINSLHGRTHEWKKGKGPEGTKYGFVAQEVREVIPELVTQQVGKKEEDLGLGVDYEHVVPILVEAIKELTERVETLSRAASRS